MLASKKAASGGKVSHLESWLPQRLTCQGETMSRHHAFNRRVNIVISLMELKRQARGKGYKIR
jgi:hypothetical protein